MAGVGTRVGEGFTGAVGVADRILVGTSGIGVSTGGTGCSSPQEVSNNMIAKNNIAKAGGLEFLQGLLYPFPLGLSVVSAAISGLIALLAHHWVGKSVHMVE